MWLMVYDYFPFGVFFKMYILINTIAQQVRAPHTDGKVAIVRDSLVIVRSKELLREFFYCIELGNVLCLLSNFLEFFMNNMSLAAVKELISIMSDRDNIVEAIEQLNDQFIESVLSVIVISKLKNDITTLYTTYKTSPHKAIATSLADIIRQVRLPELLQDYPLEDEDLQNLISDSVRSLLYYDRKGDDEINVERIEKHFKDHPEAIETAVEIFRKALIEGLSDEDDD